MQKKHILSYISLISMFFILSILAPGCQTIEPLAPKDYPISCYTATYGKGIYKSDNGGTSWFPIDSEQKSIHAYFKRLYHDPHKTDILYLTTTGAGLFTFNIQTEELKRVNRFRNESLQSLAFRNISLDRKGSFELLTGMNSGGVFKARDELKIWQPINKGLTYRDVNVLFTSGSALFAGTVKDLFKWNEASNRWASASAGIKNKNIISKGADSKGNILYAGSGAYGAKIGRFEDIPSLYKSIDKGRTWKASAEGIPSGTLVYVISINPKRPERIYIGTSDSVYRSINSGDNWQKMERGLPKSLRVFDIKIARMTDGKDVVYAAGSNGVFMTTDDDQTSWVNKSYGLAKTAITSIVLLTD